MHKQSLLSVLFLTFFLVSAFSQSASNNDFLEIDQTLSQEYDLNQPGIAVLVAQGNEVIFEKSYGLANLEDQTPLSTDMVFEIGSMTKQFTSTAILQLVEQGKIELDAPIQQYIDAYPEKRYPITVHHLLSQTSGIPEFFDVDENEFDLLNQKHTPEELINYYKNEPLLFEPGTAFKYSNSNYPLLGLIIEKVAQMPLAEYFEQFIFEPLEMTNTSLWYQEEDQPAAPTGYRFNSENELVMSPPIDGSTVYAAGGIVSTLRDLFKWYQALRTPNYISKNIVRQLQREKKTSRRKGTGYGYGFFLEELQGQPVIQHGGNMYGFTSTAMYLPKQDVYVCVLSNRALDNTKNIARYIASQVIERPMEYYRQLHPSQAVAYTGKYQLTEPQERVLEILIYEGNLVMYFPDAPGTEVALLNTGTDAFTAPNINFRVEFNRNPSGEVESFTVFQDGEYTWTKI